MATGASTRADVLELWLVVDAPGQRAREIAVEVAADVPASALVRGIADHLGLGDHARLRAFVDGRAIAEHAAVGAAGLRSGDRITLGDATSGDRHAAEAAAPLELVAVGGLSAGRRVPLPPGTHVIGREAGCTLVVDDAAASRRHLEVVVDGDAVTARDLGSANGSALNGLALGDEPQPVESGDLLRAGRTLVAVQRAAPPGSRRDPADRGVVKFNRPPRMRRGVEELVTELDAPPDTPPKPRLGLVTALVPLPLGIGFWLATGNPLMLLFSLLSPVMALASFMEERRGGRREFKDKAQAFRRRLIGLDASLEQAVAEEAAQRRAVAPDAAQLAGRALRLEPELWERRFDDDDFLALRVGSGDAAASVRLRLGAGGQPDLRERAERIAARHGTVPAVPVLVAARAAGGVGLAGPRERVLPLARWLVVQAATLHSPRDLVVAAALSDDDVDEWSWLKWLPHTRSDGSPLGGRHLQRATAGANDLLADLQRLLDTRREEASGTSLRGVAGPPHPHLLVILDERLQPDRALVSEVLAGGREGGITVLWMGGERRDIPGECGAVVELEASVGRLVVDDVGSGVSAPDVLAEGIDRDLAADVARALSAVRDVGTGRGAGQVPRRISLLEVLLPDRPLEEFVERRWAAFAGALAAPIGAGPEGPFSVDLRADGPHALIGGTTGAGKSELLQTIVGALAAQHSPARLTFLLIDYKGGAAFKECIALPHTVGLITDLDEHLTRRALTSLNAEIRRREEILRDAGAKDLVEMEQRDPDRAPPSVLLVIDEFAALAREVPEFVEGVVDVAQRGRSLGVHLMLATQRPAGVITENIRANVNLRIALRMSDGSDSTDVVGVPDAARIPRTMPGRAYARTGHSELTPFQSAYAGAISSSAVAAPPVSVRELRFGSIFQSGERGVSVVLESARSDLQRIVAASVAVVERTGLEAPRPPWLPPLATTVTLDQLGGEGAILGLVDEPQRQRQRVLTHDFEADGSLVVFGTSGSGKTTLLRTLAASLARSSTPRDLQLYGLDFATRGLVALEALPHCGSVIVGEDEERVTRLLGMLRKAIDERKQLFAAHGVSSLSAFRAAEPGTPLARIVVLLDGYPNFTAAFERVRLGELVDLVPRLVADGRPLGVHFVLTADRRTGLSGALMGTISSRVVLRMASEDEYGAIGLDLRAVRGIELPAGRGFAPDGHEVHCAIVGEDPSGEGQTAALRALGEELEASHGRSVTPAVGRLAPQVRRAELPDGAPLQPSLGVGDAELAPIALDLREQHFLVVGPYRSGRSTALATIARGLRAADADLDLRLIAPRRSPLVALDIWTSVARGAESCEDAARDLGELVRERVEGAPPIVVVIDDADELGDSRVADELETLVKRGRDTDVRVLASSETQSAMRAYGGAVRELRKEEYGLLLDPDLDVDGDILGVRLPRGTNPVFPPGRGYLVERGTFELVQTAFD